MLPRSATGFVHLTDHRILRQPKPFDPLARVRKNFSVRLTRSAGESSPSRAFATLTRAGPVSLSPQFASVGSTRVASTCRTKPDLQIRTAVRYLVTHRLGVVPNPYACPPKRESHKQTSNSQHVRSTYLRA